MQQFVSFSETGKTPVSIQSIPIKQTQVHAEVRLIRQKTLKQGQKFDKEISEETL